MTVSISNIVTELTNAEPVTKKVKLVIKGVAPIISSPTSLPNAILGLSYDVVQFTTSAGSAPIKWTASGLPKGITISEAGLLSGTPIKSGKYTITVKASNSSGATTVKLPLTVFEKPTINTIKLSDAIAGKKYNAKLTAKGTTPITWKIDNLPSTLTLTQNAIGTAATITGTPTTAETLTFVSVVVAGWRSTTPIMFSYAMFVSVTM